MSLVELYQSMPTRYPELRGQVAIVTGSGQGIGSGIAARLAREGMRVVITGLEADRVESVAQALRDQGAETLAVPGNLAETADIYHLFEATLSAFGSLYVLVNNAADLRRKAFEQVDEALIDYELAVNIKAPIMCAKRAGEIMCAAGKGRIINISTPGALRAHLPGMPYDATKGAIDSMTRALAVEWAARGVLVNGIAPGWANTWKTAQKSDAEFQAVAARIPLGRPVGIDEIGAMAAFLASDDARYITGQIMYVDGGVTAQMSPPGQPI
ncbi:MAG: SDR family oxidoreductase [Anaerolineae bacterium]|nr:SDR family oxidoreductase [Anaerolineae bacterium]